MKTQLIVLIFILCNFHPLITNQQQNYGQKSINSLSADNPIVIDGNSQLAGNATSGNGTESNPYIISDKVISCNNLNNPVPFGGVYIQNTNEYFILRNISVSLCSSGFYFANVTHGSIINSQANNNGGFGIYVLSNSYYISVNNTEMNHNYIGISIWESYDNIIYNCSVDQNYYGFWISTTSTNELLQNIATNSIVAGFYFTYASGDVIINNTITNTQQDGIYVDPYSNFNNFTNNLVSNNLNSGFRIASTFDSYYNNYAVLNTIGYNVTGVSHNTFFNNSAFKNQVGFNCLFCINTNFTFNRALSNQIMGLDINTTISSTFSNNLISLNNLGFYLDSAKLNNFKNNFATNNSMGFYLSKSSNNTMTSNVVNNNDQYGFYLNSSSNYNVFRTNQGINNSIDDFYQKNSIGNVLINNTFAIVYSTSALPSTSASSKMSTSNTEQIGGLQSFFNHYLVYVVVLDLFILFLTTFMVLAFAIRKNRKVVSKSLKDFNEPVIGNNKNNIKGGKSKEFNKKGYSIDSALEIIEEILADTNAENK